MRFLGERRVEGKEGREKKKHPPPPPPPPPGQRGRAGGAHKTPTVVGLSGGHLKLDSTHRKKTDKEVGLQWKT